jgi:hypothetical protein
VAVRYISLNFNSRDHEKVSRVWFVLLWDLHFHSPVRFNVNEGHRTMDRQRELVREKGIWSTRNPTGAAYPSSNAPHIRTLRFDHCVDLDNAMGVVEEAGRRGVALHRPLASEPWHVDPDRATLLRYYKKNRRRVWRERRRRRRAGEKV